MAKDSFSIWILTNERSDVRKLSIRKSHFVVGGLCAGVIFTACLVISTFAILESISGSKNFLGIFAYRADADVLTKVVNHLQRYEGELKLRSAALRTILEETRVMDRQVFSKTGDAADMIEFSGSEAGIGGGDGREYVGVSLRAHGGSARANLNSQSFLNELDMQMSELAGIPIGSPVMGGVSSGFGYRTSPFSKRRHFHSGVDISVDRKSRVTAVAEGKVVFAGYKGAYGRTVIVDHGNGVDTLYGHLDQISVNVGDKLCRGEKLGLVGTTGRTTGPHLHYEVHVGGVPKDPKVFIELASFLKFLS